MVSQKFMDILDQQPHYSKSSVDSSSSTVTNDVQNTLLIVKEENSDDLMATPNTSNNPSNIDGDVLDPVIAIKEEIEDINIKEEKEDNVDDWHSVLPETMKKQVSPLDQAPKEGKKALSKPCMSVPHLKDKQALRPPSKRIRKEKVIFDPSADNTHVQGNQSKKTSEIQNETCISETNKSCSKTLKIAINKCKEQWDEDLTCEYCGKYMHRSDYLRLHLMKHTGETPHKCPHCKKGYRARWRLVQHLRTHTRNLPYHCPYCNYRGNRSDYLTSHISRIHKKVLRYDRKKMKKSNELLKSLKESENILRNDCKKETKNNDLQKSLKESENVLRDDHKKETKNNELLKKLKESEVNAIFKGGEEILSIYK